MYPTGWKESPTWNRVRREIRHQGIVITRPTIRSRSIGWAAVCQVVRVRVEVRYKSTAIINALFKLQGVVQYVSASLKTEYTAPDSGARQYRPRKYMSTAMMMIWNGVEGGGGST
jgi:hypothetical protein